MAIVALAVLGLGASLYALYVHYMLVTDPGYAPICNISETVSCTQVFQSAYGSVGGVPVAAGGAIWSALVLILAVLGLNLPNRERSSRIASHIFLASTIALAAVFYFAYASFFVLKQACPVCLTMYASVVGVFLISAASAGSLGAVFSNLSADVGALQRDQKAVTAGVAWLAAAIALVAFFPRAQVLEASSSSRQTLEAPPPVPVEPLTAEQQGEWERWLDQQPRTDATLPTGDTKVRLIKFNDYQCPSCKQTWLLYKDIIAKYEASHPQAFKYESRDFPLDGECGLNAGHGAACELAAAVRMADAKGKKKDAEIAFFARQSPTMTRDEVKATLQEVAQIPGADFDAQYAAVLKDVRADSLYGQQLGVRGTPTFYLNGIQMPNVRPSHFDAAIAYLLRKAGA